MLSFFSKKPAPKEEPKKLYFPEDRIEEAYALADLSRKSLLGKYKFLQFIYGVFPETKYGKWEFNSSFPSPFVVEDNE